MTHPLKHLAARSVLVISLWLLATNTFAQTASNGIRYTASAQSHSKTAVGPRRTAIMYERPESAPASSRAKRRNRRIGIALGVTLGTVLVLGAGFAIGAAAVARSGGYSIGPRF